MWYDKYPDVPERGSPLETVFILVALQRKDAELMATRALVLGSMAEDTGTRKTAIKGFQEFCDTMFPFLEQAGELDKQKDMQRLLDHVKHPMRIDVGSIKAERAAAAKQKAHNKFKIRRVEIPGITRKEAKK